MSSLQYGYVRGERIPVRVRVDSSTSDISVGDLLVWDTAGYAAQAAAGDIPFGVAMQAVDSPSADGNVSILADVSPHSIYRYPPDTGSVTVGLIGKTCDVGGPQSLDIDASTDDCVRILDVDTDEGTVLCQILTNLADSGVV